MGNIGSLVSIYDSGESSAESYNASPDLLFPWEPHGHTSSNSDSESSHSESTPEIYSGDTIPLDSTPPIVPMHLIDPITSGSEHVYLATIGQRFARDFRRLLSILEKDPDAPGLVIFGHCSGYTEADSLQVGDRIIIQGSSIEGGRTFPFNEQVVIVDKRYLEDQVDNGINNVYSTVASLLTSSYLPDDLKDDVAENSSHLTFFRHAMEGEELNVPVAFVVKKC